MEELIEQVISLCPDCDRDEVERDLSLTGDIEMTINHALDGMLSPKGLSFSTTSKSNPVTLIMDDNDDVLVVSTSKFTDVKERSVKESELSNRNDNDAQFINPETTKPIEISRNDKKNKNKISFDFSDSNSDLTDGLEICRKTLERLKSSVINIEASSSKMFKDNTSPKHSVPSSPDSDSELLKPAFSFKHCQNTDVKLKENTSKSSALSGRSDNSKGTCTVVDSGVDITATVKEHNGGLGSFDHDVCLNEPVKKKRRTKEEIEKRKQEAMLKKAAKEKEKQAKLDEKKRQKEARAAALHEKKMQKEKDQLEKKAERLTKSANKLDGCTKFITVCLDSALFPEDIPDPNANLILQKLISMEASYVIASQPYPGSISWQRTSVQHSVQEDELKITTLDCCKEENEILVVLPAERFAEMVFSFKQGYIGEHEVEEHTGTLVDFTKHVKSIYHGKKVTLIVNGLEKYMRNVKLKQQRAFRNAASGEPAVEDGARKRRRKKTQPVLDVTRTDIEEALVDMQIKCNVCVYHCETYEDVALKVAVFTKAVAEKPYKKSLSDEIGFCLDRLDKTSLKVSKDGQGMINVWQQQIQQFRNVSREMAAAIVAEYPSPQILKQTYEQCRSVQDAMLLLEDIVVRRGGGSLATSRRIGPELSKRFYVLFHSKQNNDLVKG